MMTAIRGCDTPQPKIKPVVRWIRQLLLINGNDENDFSRPPDKLPSVEDFEDELEYAPLHYFLHLFHTLEIIGFKHPDPETSDIAFEYYLRLCSWMHVAPETEEEMDERLSGKPGTTGSAKSWVQDLLGSRKKRRPEKKPSPPVHTNQGRYDSY
jgi:hypothetical protein